MKRIVAYLVAAALSVPTAASADIAPEPCEGAKEGDACETSGGEAGVCEGSEGDLTCEAGGSADDGCSASPSTLEGAAPGLAFVAVAGLALVVARRRKPS